MKRTLTERIENRRVKQPSFLAQLILKTYAKIMKKKLHINLNIIDQIPKKGPCFILFNHMSRLDFVFVTLAAKSRRINFVAAYHEHYRKKYYLAFKMAHTIPKHNYSTDLKAISNIREAINKGYAVAIAPEARNSNYGCTSPIVKGTGKFVAQFNVPIYLVKITGSYLTFPKVCSDIRRGKIDVTVKRLPLETVKADNLDNYLNEEFRTNEFEWQNKEHTKWSHKMGMATDFDFILYQCPKCHQEFTLKGKDDTITCSHCGYQAKIDEYYTLTDPLNKFTDISKWVRWEKGNIIKDIRKNKNYLFQVPVTLETLDKYHTYKTSMGKVCGSGTFTINHFGIRYDGDKGGLPFQLNLSYKDIWTIGITQNIRSIFFYYNNEYYHLVPNYHCALKIKMIIEEMQRLHENIWPNFPWEEDLYH
ncbi:MAG: 1-acyl-sn-glycerol-3-phosphate acyltransferase [Bacilli bacterium]|nr:1-acyl-sn-glycerol-3-phosphate acyltransferase [Bacilli bacterium]